MFLESYQQFLSHFFFGQNYDKKSDVTVFSQSLQKNDDINLSGVFTIHTLLSCNSHQPCSQYSLAPERDDLNIQKSWICKLGYCLVPLQHVLQ